MHNVFINIYHKISTYKAISFVGALTIILGLVFVASKIQFEEDITKLIPVDERSEALQKVLKQVNFADKIIVNIKQESEGSVDDLVSYADAFVKAIDSTSKAYIKTIQGKVGDDVMNQTLDFAYHNLPLLLDPEDYENIAKKLNNDSIQVITQNNYKTLVSPSGLIAKKMILRDPLGLTFMGLKKLQSLSFGDDFSVHNGYLLSKDQQHILLFISPTYKSSETDKNATFATHLYALNKQLNKQFEQRVSAEYFGGALVAVANANQIKFDIQLTMSIALSILLVILILFYKKLLLPFILFIPTALGALIAIVVLYVIRTKISAISLGIGSVLLGVTLDYALHVLTHIRSNNDAKALYKEITKPILMSSLTTALAFLCLLFLKSQALQDLGIFAAISVLSASVFALILIPQLYKNTQQKNSKNTAIDKLARFGFHKTKFVIGGLVIVLVLSLFTYNKVVFNKDLNKLNYQPAHLVEANNRLEALINSTSKSVYISAYGANEEAALKTNQEIFKALDDLKSHDEIIAFSSIGALVKSQKTQVAKINDWQKFWEETRKDSLITYLETNAAQFGFKPNTFKQFYTHLDKGFSPLSIEDYNALPFVATEDYISKTEGFVTVSTLIKLNNDKVSALKHRFENQSNTVLIDRQDMNETFLGNLKNDFNRLVFYSLIVVLAILLVFYRSVSLTLVTIIPIGLTWLITIGLMGLLQIEFNIFNIIISTFIFGLGVDYCIFITNGLLHHYKFGTDVLPTYKTSIILSVITTILGVGALIFAKHPALYTIASVSIIGILSAILISFTLQPLLFKLFIGSVKKRPISLRLFLHSVISFGYFGLGGLILSLLSVSVLKIIPVSKKVKMKWFHTIISKFKKSVLYTNPFVKKTILNPSGETFEKQAIIIANHTSFLDILAIGMLHSKIIFLVNDWVYNSPIFGRAVRLAGFYPVSSGIDNGLEHLQRKVAQGYTLMAFPEGTRSTTNKMKRFHKGAFYLAEQFQLDVVPVLIHGNSEVNPKGSFVIKDGSITLKILERIPFKDERFGTSYKERTKAISKYFKEEFEKLRQEIETPSYFNNSVLEEYRYKGHDVYQVAKADLKKYAALYHKVSAHIGTKSSITYLSESYGQLAFLLALKYPDRKIGTYLKDQHMTEISRHSFLTNADYKLHWESKLEAALNETSNILIMDINDIDILEQAIAANTYEKILLIKSATTLKLSAHIETSYIVELKASELQILKRA